MIRRGIGVQSFVSAGGAGTDADAQAFIDAAGITDATQQSAINTLVTDLKGYGIWTKMKAIYPFLGGTSSTHKWNLKDPRDLDAAFRLVFSGGGTHASTGWTPNAINGYADTFLSPLNNLTLYSAHLSFYSRNNVKENGFDMGAYTPTGTTYPMLGLRTRFGGDDKARHYSYNGFFATDAAVGNVDTNSSGLTIGSRISSTSNKLYKNGIQTGATNTSTALNTTTSNNVFIGAMSNNNVAENFTSKECAFASIGDGLTDTEAANLYTAVQAYQTTLNRNI